MLIVVAKRRWLRFSLRTLLSLVILIGASLGWTIYKVRQQRIAVSALMKMGCSIEYRNTQNRSPTVLESLRRLLGEESRSVFWMHGNMSQITDAGLLHLHGLSQVQWLSLQRTQVSDVGLAHLRGLHHLEAISLDGTQITDAGLVHLRGLPRLL